jgi:agmatinase
MDTSSFDPSGIGLHNGQFIGLPYTADDARIILMPAPWDVTVSYRDGTSTAAANILQASYQLDLYDAHVKDAWKFGLHLLPANEMVLAKSQTIRKLAQKYIDFLESGGDLSKSPAMQKNLTQINKACDEFRNWVADETAYWLDKGKLVGLVGGDHSTPLGYLQTLATRHSSFGVLHLDAHLDLRQAYEGFKYSHASIYNNAMRIPQIEKLVSVGIRDYCDEELSVAEAHGKRIKIYFDHRIRQQLFEGDTFKDIATKTSRQLPKNIYISFDIDVLRPYLCPNTGTPVPGGLEFEEVTYLLNFLVEKGHRIIGFDLSEVAGIGHEWDGNVGARVLYKLANLMGKSQGY